ncbi:MFS general substrate transporter [Rhizodiscina lignyota]|uniref:MFS general substrate transporter n=1 Tax=Rhizodiscina lignyota TaxID=1504668 RepID=A0A9P4M6N7_9PEZI|nr:MFS general substrate transporter [Rhizodiscina lignyota]
MAVGQKDAGRTGETSPLLPKEPQTPPKYGKSVLYRILLCAFLVSLSFGVTQVPLIYVCRVMTCQAFYSKNPDYVPAPGKDRCSNPTIEANTARSVALIGASTTFFGLINLFITSWSVKKFGVKNALLVQVFNPAVRLAIQNVGVTVGGDLGLTIIQCSQIITIIGGPNGYILSLNSFVAEVVESRERTGSLGKLQGCMFFGTATGYLAGGLISDWFEIITPFRVTLVLFVASTIYVFLFLPRLPPHGDANGTKNQAKSLARFFGPLKIFVPHKWVLSDGRVQRQYGPMLLGAGAFFGVLATGYLPVLFQMYSTDVFGFGTKENSFLVSLHSVLRGVFLTMMFPRIISGGRTWLSRREQARDAESRSLSDSSDGEIATDPNQIDTAGPMDNEQEPVKPPKQHDEKETFEFDLLFCKISLIADGILTAFASFVSQGWQLYIVAALLPFASGTGAAAKGTMLQMCMASERVDALSAITLLENIARLSTTGLFGLIFAAFASIEKTYLVFICNGAVALLGFFVLIFSRFPPEGSRRLEDDEHHEVPEAS